jgi:DNA-binding MarR family transcriptional regulator
MEKKYIDKFYDTTLKSDKYEVLAFALPINLIYKSMYNESEQFFKSNYDLIHSDIDVMATLYFNGNALTPTELYSAAIFSSGGMTKVLKKLEERKLIFREASSNDKRSMLVCLTPLGEELIKECMDEVIKMKEKIFDVLSKKEKDSLKKILSKITYSFV